MQHWRDVSFSVTALLWICLVSLIARSAAELTVEAEHRVIELPPPHTSVPNTIINIACFISQTPHNVRWIAPDGTNVLTQAGQYTVSHGEIGLATGEMRYGSLLIVQDLSYQNAGVYVCEAMMQDDCSSFPKLATVELVLKMKLRAARKSVVVTYNKSLPQSVELECETSGYIRPDSDIQWFRENQLLAEGEKYNVTFRDGRPDAAQIGLNETAPSRVSILTIARVEESDSDVYSCQSVATGAIDSTHLYVEAERATTDVPTPSTPSQSPSSPSTTLTRSARTDCSVGVAAAIITTFILTSALAAVIGFAVAFLWFKGRQGRRIKSGVSSPDLGSSAHATSHTNVSEQVDMYRISTGGEEMEGSSGDSPDTGATK